MSKKKPTYEMCTYCEKIKFCLEWEKTHEMVCYNCRLEFLNEEFGL